MDGYAAIRPRPADRAPSHALSSSVANVTSHREAAISGPRPATTATMETAAAAPAAAASPATAPTRRGSRHPNNRPQPPYQP